ncbi:MAG: hypothetical protein ABI418_05595 [Jatrophihabitantaceae bacterium]
MNPTIRRCCCGARSGLARRAGSAGSRLLAAGLAWSGLAARGASHAPESTSAVRRWCLALRHGTAPCCPFALLALGGR